MKMYLVIAEHIEFVTSACVEATDKNNAIAKAGIFNGYDPNSDDVDIVAVYEITGSDLKVELI